MGEIKSTLEIIMEKTKGLTMTEEEKEELRLKELTGKVRGLVQKFLDGLLDLEALRAEVAALGEEEGQAAKRIIKQEAVERIALAADNRKLLDMMQGIAGVDVRPAKDLIAEYEDRLKQEAEARMQVLAEALKEKGIFGSAVIPNLRADPDWGQHVVEMRNIFKTQLDGLMDET